ncbi:MAG: tripartite tricarboxylate transporter substrate binding protein [Sulfuricaulis sp.]|nr:tripartite tricarboxylate transporter substrate binding protein [Sulfuricaulis sp.]
MRICRLILATTLAVTSTALLAENYPSKPITLVVGFTPGGGADAVARPMAEAIGKQLGQTVVMDYRPGAGGSIASAYVAKAPSDGYTVYMNSSGPYGADHVLFKGLKYDAASFTPITRWTETPLILAVNARLGIRSTQELISRARAQPDHFTYASSGSGTATHLAPLLFESAAGVKFRHVPYKGGAPAALAVAAGDVDLNFASPPSIAPISKTGRVTLLAVTSAQRSPMFPDLPAVSEAGLKDANYTFWWGLFGPAGLPKEVVDKLFEASAKALAEPEIRAKLEKSGNQPAPSPSVAEFTAWARTDGLRLKELTEKSGAGVD